MANQNFLNLEGTGESSAIRRLGGAAHDMNTTGRAFTQMNSHRDVQLFGEREEGIIAFIIKPQALILGADLRENNEPARGEQLPELNRSARTRPRGGE